MIMTHWLLLLKVLRNLPALRNKCEAWEFFWNLVECYFILIKCFVMMKVIHAILVSDYYEGTSMLPSYWAIHLQCLNDSPSFSMIVWSVIFTILLSSLTIFYSDSVFFYDMLFKTSLLASLENKSSFFVYDEIHWNADIKIKTFPLWYIMKFFNDRTESKK